MKIDLISSCYLLLWSVDQLVQKQDLLAFRKAKSTDSTEFANLEGHLENKIPFSIRLLQIDP